MLAFPWSLVPMTQSTLPPRMTQLHHRRHACPPGMEVCSVCCYEEVSRCWLRCRRQPHLLQREQCYVAGRRKEILRWPTGWTESPLQGGLSCSSLRTSSPSNSSHHLYNLH